MRVPCITFIVILLSASAVLAGSAGTTGFELFRMDGSARNSALGGSQIAVGGDLQNLYSNPAGLGEVTAPLGTIGYFKHVLDLNSGNLAYARPVEGIGVLAAGITYFDYGKFDRANEFGHKEGEFSASDILLTISAARGLRKNLSGGASLKFLNSTIDSYSASALAMDAGVLFHTGYNKWSVGAGVYNLGFATSAYLEEKDKLPTTYKLGISAPLEHLPVRFSAAGEFLEAEGIRGAGGLEISFSQYVLGRLGYNTVGIDQRVGLDRDALAGFSAGFGLRIQKINFDYSLTSQGEIGFLHRFVLGTAFGR